MVAGAAITGGKKDARNKKDGLERETRELGRVVQTEHFQWGGQDGNCDNFGWHKKITIT